MRGLPLAFSLLGISLPVTAGTLDVKTRETLPVTVSAATPADRVLAPGDPIVVIDMIDLTPESVIQLGPVPGADCYRGNIFFSDAAAGATGAGGCP